MRDILSVAGRIAVTGNHCARSQTPFNRQVGVAAFGGTSLLFRPTRPLRAGSLETPKHGVPCFEGNETYLIAPPQRLLEAAPEAAKSAGVNAYVLSDEVKGESRVVGMVHAALARAVSKRGEPLLLPCVILSGGETTVTVRPRESGQV